MTGPHAPVPHDPVPAIVSSGREIDRDDIEMLWADLIEGRYTWQQTSERALAFVETVNVPNHIVSWGLMELYHLWRSDTAPDLDLQRDRREQWRAQLREYDLDPAEWDFSYYRRMLVGHFERCGVSSAERFATELILDGYLRQSDADFVLGIARMPDSQQRGLDRG